MTELERARKHLGDTQCELAFVRANGGSDWGIGRSEEDVLAALSWVWQEQEREKAGKLINDYGVPWIREALGAFP